MATSGDIKSTKKLLVEGKTKQIYELSTDEVLVISKNMITAFDGVKKHDLEDKAATSTKTTTNIFAILNEAGIKTAYVQEYDSVSFKAKKCDMIPIEWVTRRLATGSFLRRNPGVVEGTRFCPVILETFYKDDAKNDPQWSDEQIIASRFQLNGVTTGYCELDIMKKTTVAVFEILEKYWASENCVLVDIKIEFGVNSEGDILVADVIDNDSWRLWPAGDKKLMKDKQVYRNLNEVTNKDLVKIKNNYKWVADKTDSLTRIANNSLIVILMGSASDQEFGQKIAMYCENLNLKYKIRISSAHKSTSDVLRIIAEYEASEIQIVYIAIAGRSNGLGLVLSANTVFPVINCPPASENISIDIWSSLRLPSGIGCSTVIYPEAAVLTAAHILALNDTNLWAKLKAKQLHNYINIKIADRSLNDL